MAYTESATVEGPILEWLQGLGWRYIRPEELDRDLIEAFDKAVLCKTLLRLNPINIRSEVEANRVVTALASLPNDVSGNKEFFDWLRGEASIGLRAGEKNQTVRLIDYDNTRNNVYTVTNQLVFQGYKNRRPDILLYVNGIPLILIECKAQTTEEIDYTNAINQIIRYNDEIPQLTKHLAYACATDGVQFRYGWTKPNRYNRWRNGYADPLESAVKNLLKPETVLDFIQNFIVFETEGGEITKKIAMQQQVEATNRIINRVLREPDRKTGLIWHTQGSGKTLTMLYTAWKLKRQPELRNPTIIVLIDRKQLEEQFKETFTNAALPYTRLAESIADLEHLIETGSRQVIITTIQKFQDIQRTDPRDNIIILIDEAHRSQYGQLAVKRNKTFPNARLFAFTGTPIERDQKPDTFKVFARPGEELYLHKYSIRQSIEDGSTVPIKYQPRLTREHIPREILDKEFLKIASGLDRDEQEKVLEKAARLREILKADDRVTKIAADIAQHYKDYIEPNGWKAQVVVCDREACAKMKEQLDKHLPPEYSEVIFSGNINDPPLLRKYHLTSDQQKKITNKAFQDPKSLPKLLIVTDMLLTGFDAPIEQAMYLDKPLRDHTLLQAIARTNRPNPGKTHGLIIDYIGIFHRIQEALNFEVTDIEGIADNLDTLKEAFQKAITKTLTILDGMPRDPSRESLYKIIRHLETGDNYTQFKQGLTETTTLFESLSPDPWLHPYLRDYTWLQKIQAAYNKHTRRDRDSLKPYQEKTRELIQQNLILQDIDKTLPVFDINADYLKKVEEQHLNSDDEIAELRQALTVHIRLNLNALKTYETLGEKLDRIIKLKDPEQLKLELRNLVEENNRIEAELREKNITKLQKSIILCIQEALPATEEELIPYTKKLTEELEPLLFPGWDQKQDTHKSVQQQVFQRLHSQYKDRVDDPKRLLTLRDEIIEWLQKSREQR